MFRIFLFSFLFFLAGCGNDQPTVTQNLIEKSYRVDLLKNEIYYFPAKKSSDAPTLYLPLKPFDLIFAGHDQNSSHALISAAIPGRYTHMLLYIGKDDEGFAYGVEMNTVSADTFHIGADGLQVDGRLYVYCLGSDFGEKECPQDLYHNGLETYDFLWARELSEPLYTEVTKRKERLLRTIRQDLQNAFPFQLPMHIGLDSFITKTIYLVDDGRTNGADCTEYIASLFEEVAGVCPRDIRVTAPQIVDYFTEDPVGKTTILPAKYNIFGKGDLQISELFTKEGYTLVGTSRKTSCNDTRIVAGIPIPQLFFESPDLRDILPVEQNTTDTE